MLVVLYAVKKFWGVPNFSGSDTLTSLYYCDQNFTGWPIKLSQQIRMNIRYSYLHLVSTLLTLFVCLCVVFSCCFFLIFLSRVVVSTVQHPFTYHNHTRTEKRRVGIIFLVMFRKEKEKKH